MSRARKSVKEEDIKKYESFIQNQKEAKGFGDFKFTEGEGNEEGEEEELTEGGEEEEQVEDPEIAEDGEEQVKIEEKAGTSQQQKATAPMKALSSSLPNLRVRWIPRLTVPMW